MQVRPHEKIRLGLRILYWMRAGVKHDGVAIRADIHKLLPSETPDSVLCISAVESIIGLIMGSCKLYCGK